MLPGVLFQCLMDIPVFLYWLNLFPRYLKSNFGLVPFRRFPSERHGGAPADGAAQRRLQRGGDVRPVPDHLVQLHLRGRGQVVRARRGALPLPHPQCRHPAQLTLPCVPAPRLSSVQCCATQLSAGTWFLTLLLVTDWANCGLQPLNCRLSFGNVQISKG